jgi:hypothetical protein
VDIVSVYNRLASAQIWRKAYAKFLLVTSNYKTIRKLNLMKSNDMHQGFSPSNFGLAACLLALASAPLVHAQTNKTI